MYLLQPALEAIKAQRKFTVLENKRVFYSPRTQSPWETDAQIRKTAWQPALKLAGVRYRYPYQARHTYASMMLTFGEEPSWIEKQMGHADWAMIRKTYARWIPEASQSDGKRAGEVIKK